MTVHIENIGAGGGGTMFPPRGTQVPDFFDDFNRPDALTLGRQWANWWMVSDEWNAFPNADLDDRPHPFNCAVNPSIAANQCVFWTRATGVSWTACTPLPLAWMTQNFFDQYVECDIVQCAPLSNPDAAVAIWVMLCFSCNPGSVPINNGGYITGLSVGPDGLTAIGALLRIQFGLNPSASYPLPEGGLSYFQIPYGLSVFDRSQRARQLPEKSPESVSPVMPFVGEVTTLPLHVRMEARHASDGWTISIFQNGVFIGSATDNTLGPGMPGLVLDQMPGSTDNLQQLATVDNFKAGWLR